MTTEASDDRESAPAPPAPVPTSDRVHYLFLDLETTGLDEREGEIMEVACCLTDQHFREKGEMKHYVIHSRPWSWAAVNPTVRKMHTSSGLREESLASNYRLGYVENELVHWLRGFNLNPRLTLLAGHSVHFDLRWISYHMRTLRTYVSHRVLDMTSIEYMVDVSVCDGSPRDAHGQHRAKSDVEYALGRACDHYRRLKAVLVGGSDHELRVQEGSLHGGGGVRKSAISTHVQCGEVRIVWPQARVRREDQSAMAPRTAMSRTGLGFRNLACRCCTLHYTARGRSMSDHGRRHDAFRPFYETCKAMGIGWMADDAWRLVCILEGDNDPKPQIDASFETDGKSVVAVCVPKADPHHVTLRVRRCEDRWELTCLGLHRGFPGLSVDDIVKHALVFLALGWVRTIVRRYNISREEMRIICGQMEEKEKP